MDSIEKKERSKFPALYWLVVLFEFFERGSYYGMMSVLSVYLTDVLNFEKQDVGVIKSTIQPLLYFLPIISGALADRFGYRKVLLIAFTFLGCGYLLTSHTFEYASIFLALIVMGIGAGIFKPIISGTIARTTDDTNSTLGFGIFYWSINLGAFLFPLILVPYLKNNIGWQWVFYASAIGTGSMIIPTLIFFKEPPIQKNVNKQPKNNLLQTLANAFEIIYSPFILLYRAFNNSSRGKWLTFSITLGLLIGGLWNFFNYPLITKTMTSRTFVMDKAILQVQIERNLCNRYPYLFKKSTTNSNDNAEYFTLKIHDPDKFDIFENDLISTLHRSFSLKNLDSDSLKEFIKQATKRYTIVFNRDNSQKQNYVLKNISNTKYLFSFKERNAAAAYSFLKKHEKLNNLSQTEIAELMEKASQPNFFLLFLSIMLIASFIIIRFTKNFRKASNIQKIKYIIYTLAGIEGLLTVLHLVFNVSLFSTILCCIIGGSLIAIFAIDHEETEKYKDHFQFLLMIFIYSGFWVLYFQMFDAVLWYVQAYVSPESLNNIINSFLQFIGISTKWWFDVEHVTVINAGTIILLQLIISFLVKNTKALPTMISGIALGTFGMAVLAISSNISVFILGIMIFSIGEMTAHPKFISYVGQSAPKERVAMYMGYLFLYGVIGSSIGGVLGANLYVKFIDELNRPKTLWLIFSGIGLVTIFGLLLFNKFIASKQKESSVTK